jgi:hypothetical protein
VLIANHRRVARLQVNVPDTANHGGPHRCGGLGQRLTSLGMSNIQCAGHTGQHPIQRCSHCLGLRRLGHLVVGHRPRHIAAPRVQQRLLQVEPEQLGHPPTNQHLAAHLVPIGPLAFQHDDLVAVSGHHGGQRRSSESATHHDHIS